ncbi:MAG TPA: dihydrofolate reductase family protein [Propionibacteriaceae bacterium]|nr:dihydrofolate reductase family protein [Propionibacteriaceae bacterium]
MPRPLGTEVVLGDDLETEGRSDAISRRFPWGQDADMANLIYTAITSLDGYVVDADGSFDWAAPDEEVHAFVNELERPVGTYLLGRRMYEVMRYWETALSQAGLSAVEQEYARIWPAADKIVYSSTLSTADTARTRVERTFDTDRVRDLKGRSDSDLSVGGPHLATSALRAGLVDQLRQFLAPVVVGGGTSMFPNGLRMSLELLDERRFASGFVYLQYAVRA